MVEVEKGNPSEFKVAKTPGGWDCLPFEVVTHTCHVLPAIEVLRTGKLAAGLVYDASHLNKHRIPVVWLSPNSWNDGYRYGNVQFAFPFATLCEGRRAYWVEVARYSPAAPRILLTHEDRDGHPDLTPYDETKRKGPWWFNGKQHHSNHTVCVEFMVEGPLRLADTSKVTFVPHHPEFCCVTPKRPKECKEIGMHADKGCGRFLARLVSEQVPASAVPFVPELLAMFCGRLVQRLARKARAGSITASDEHASAVARAAFAAIGSYRDEDAKALMSMFKSEADAEAACWRVLAAALGRDLDKIQPADE